MELSDLCGSCFGSRGDGPFCIHCGFREGDPAENPLHLKPGTVLKDQYIIGRVLGCGGFGVTYLAYDMNLHMVKAIKEYLPSSLATRGADGVSVCAFTGQSAEHYAYGLKEFIREGRILAMFAGVSSVVSVYDYFAENNTAYLVMEYLKGKDLAAYLNQRGGRIPWDEIQPIFAPVMQVLQQVHAAGLIHRDISPDNIYLTDDGQVKLIDFGAARQAIGERSQSLTVILKQGYAPPEQYQSNGNQGPWTDVYAMGATIYRCLTGVTPTESMTRVMQDDLKPVSQLGAALPQNAEIALSQSLNLDLRSRFSSMEAFFASLLQGTPVPRVQTHAALIGGGESFVQKAKFSIFKPLYIKITAAVLAVGLIIALLFAVVLPLIRYNTAMALFEAGEYKQSGDAFREMGSYRDSVMMLARSLYREGEEYYNDGEFEDAAAPFEELAEYYPEAEVLVTDAQYMAAVKYGTLGKFDKALEGLEDVADYANAPALIAAAEAEDSKPFIEESLSHDLPLSEDDIIDLVEQYEGSTVAFNPEERTATPTAEATPALPDGPGNTSGNIANGGIAAESDGWIYYRSNDGGSIYRMKNDGTEETKLNNEGSWFINVVGDRVYYIASDDDYWGSGSICKMRTDGTEQTVVADGDYRNLIVADGWVYFLQEERIVRMKPDGSEKEQLPAQEEGDVTSFWVEGDTVVYYNRWETEDEYGYIEYLHISRMGVDGSGYEVLDTQGYRNGRGDWFYNLQVQDGVIYYLFGGGNDYTIRKVPLEGGTVQAIRPGVYGSYCLNVQQDGGFYCFDAVEFDEKSLLLRLNPDGTGLMQLCTIDEWMDSIYNLCIAGDWAYYQVYNGVFMVNTAEPPQSEYLIPGSDSRYITEADLIGFDAATARLARNEIFARHGYTFADPELQAYFEGKSWYTSIPGCNNSNPPDLNEYEDYNVRFIQDYEQGLGGNIELQDNVAYLYDLPMVRVAHWTDSEEEFNDMREVDGGYMVMCDMYEYATVTYDEYQRLLAGQTVSKPYGNVSLDLSSVDSEDEWVVLYIDDDGWDYEMAVPSPGESSLIWEPNPLIYYTETKEMFIASDAIVHTISSDWDIFESTYDHKTFAQFLEEGSDYGGYAVVLYTLKQGNEILEMVEMYTP